jgi:hypothetical protein
MPIMNSNTISAGGRQISSGGAIGSAEGERRTILMTGVWPPTNIASPDGILAPWAPRVENYLGTGYDVVAVATEFPAGPLGTTGVGDRTRPYWGAGTGDITVDYRHTSQRFWRLVAEHKPVAIMSFSRNTPDRQWVLELGALNLPQADWKTEITYVDADGEPRLGLFPEPFAGGGKQDYSPFRGGGVADGLPPDCSVPAGFGRESTLPRDQISSALRVAFSPSQIEPVIGENFTRVGPFVSGYMAYHVSWHAALSTETAHPCLAAGHTHVGIDVDVADGRRAVEIQLETLITYLRNGAK